MSDVLAIDQGTTNTKALLMTRHATVAAQASRQVAVTHPRPGYAEQSAQAIWEGTKAAALDCIRAPGADIGALAIANQRESILLWDRATGEPVGPCVSWQCRRSGEIVEKLRTPANEALASARTGLALDPMFSAGKLAWLLRNVPGAAARAADGALCAGTVDSWLVFKLTGGAVHATDHGNAARTQLFDIDRLAWDADLCALFDVPVSILPQPMASDSRFGTTQAGSGLPAGIPIQAVMGDSHAALYGHRVRTPDAIKATLGTGTSLMALSAGDTPTQAGIARTIAWTEGGATAYAREGNILVSAQALTIMAGLLGLADAQALCDLAGDVPDADGVVLVPAFAGLGAPHWDEHARASLDGLTLATSRANIARATLDAIAHQIADVLDAMGLPLGGFKLLVDGGASVNDRLLTILSDIAGAPVERSALSEMTAWGVAAMAGIAGGIWRRDEAAAAMRGNNAAFAPGMPEASRREMRLRWQEAIRRVRRRGNEV
jgi:glycerol kinase